MVARKRGFIPVTVGASFVATAAVGALLFIAMAGFTSAGGAEVPPTPGDDCKKLKNPPPEAAGAAGAWMIGDRT